MPDPRHRLAALACAAWLFAATIAPTAYASRLEEKAVELGPGIEPPLTGGALVLETPEGVADADAHARLTVRLLLDKDGAVRRATAKSATDPRLAAAAVAHLETMSFTPAKRGKKPVAVWCDKAVSFRPRKELDAEIPAPGCAPAAYDLDHIDDPADDVELPRLLAKVDPVYPPELIAGRTNGMARFACLVDTCGRVRDCRVLAASLGAFARAGLAAVEKRRYVPALRDGKPVTIRLTIGVTFTAF